jgi:hypothetical protein
MVSTGVPIITAPGIPTDATRPLPVRDQLLTGVANAGVRFFFDIAFPWCYPGGDPANRPAAGNPTAGAVVRDIAEKANGLVSLGGSPTGAMYAGGGLDVTNAVVGATSGPLQDTGVVAPASVLADLFAAFNGNSQQFLICFYVKLPKAVDWVNSGGIISFAADKSYQTNPSLGTLAFTLGSGASVGGVQWRRQNQTGAGVETVGTVTAEAEDFGTVCQIIAWRNATGQGLRLRSLTSGKAAKLATLAAGVQNPQDFSANTFAVGRAAAFPGVNGSVSTMFNGVRIYRGVIENLARSGRDPVAVADADFARQQARNLFS